ncbi:MAG: sigma-70 family RNA polymerase sigma factor [Prevotellaceae bacterium]|nr:sigma-70 family RNA polymerase sigma factor [Prevotellaceae bacterium]
MNYFGLISDGCWKFQKGILPYHRKLYGIAYKILGNQIDAEDIVQETYIKLWRRRTELESLINPESYAVTLLKNSCLDFLRKVRPELSEIYETNMPLDDSLISRIEDKEKLVYVQNIIEKLPAQQKLVIELKVWDNLSNEEIENVTGLTQGNIKMIISRARKTIKEMYKKWEKMKTRDLHDEIEIPEGLESRLEALIDRLAETEKRAKRKTGIRLWTVAAGIIVILTAGLLLIPENKPVASFGVRQIDDPEVAYREVKKALELMSENLNKGLNELDFRITSEI